ncbi:Ribose-5-phosphate isomerase A [Nosema granulosis]|uniref:Ribose-5-phosphate isomerase n=1 Tax=Nosema granulosis TaxID=83296 RepID=A0A9P6GZY9_9MICR|nr:Ribose-5-phosphate isomerase A [Nosema granulosis]
MKEKILNCTDDKEIIGIGTGSTVEKFIKYLNKDKTYVASSYQTMIALHKYNLKTTPLALVSSVDLYIDGADYFDNIGNLIKGKGGALTNEKLLCSMSREVMIIAQDYKFRDNFENCYVPIEIIPQSLNYIRSILVKTGLPFSLRTGTNKHGPVLTDNGNLIFDVKYNYEFINKIKNICGVVEHGYFEGSSYNVILEIFSKDLTRIN